MKLRILPFVLILLVAGCVKSNRTGKRMGYIPVYSAELEGSLNFKASPQELENPGKIYVYGNLLLVVEVSKGIHVFDNTDATNPVNKAFYKIPNCTDMAVKNSVMFANIGNGIISIDISNPEDAKFLDVIVDKELSQFPDLQASNRNEDGLVVFKCPVDENKTVVRWEYGEIEGSYCTIR